MNLKILAKNFGQSTNLIKRSNLIIAKLRSLSSSLSNVKKENLTDSKLKQIVDRNRIFNEELTKQNNCVGRISKIEVKVVDCKPHPNTTLLMNKNLSTPADCARHLSELFYERSVIATVDGQIWDMCRPLEKDCTITFHHFNEEDNYEINKAFWRSCSFLLGKVIVNSFKDEVPVYLHSWPKPNFKSGSFLYDVQLPTLENWKPTDSELLTLTKSFWELYPKRLPFERLEVPISVAKEIFKDNPFKSMQLEEIEKKDVNSNVTLYRVGKFIDFSIGPMIPHTAIIGKVNVSAVYQINTSFGKLYRFQGIALPTQLPMHFYSYEVLLKRSKKLNLSKIP